MMFYRGMTQNTRNTKTDKKLRTCSHALQAVNE
jgi:hypothetical protein